MNKVELNDQTLDSYDVLRKELKTRWPDFSIDGFEIKANGSVYATLDKYNRRKDGRGVSIECVYVIATMKKGTWKIKEV